MNIDNFLEDLKIFWVENDIPNISLKNARFLRDLIKISKTKNMLEIWMANWFSTINFAIELKKNDGKITTIDFSPNSYEMALLNFEKSGFKDFINPILWNALDEIPKLENESFDFVFIDAMKKRSLDFFKLSFPKLKNWWILIIDDVIKFKEKMWWLESYLKEKNIIYNILPIDLDDGILMIVK